MAPVPYVEWPESDLLFIDAPTFDVAAGPEATWDAIVAAGPREGRFWRIAQSERPAVHVLEGSHPFAVYRLAFRVHEAGTDRSVVTAESRAVFPGLKGSAYRAAVIGSRFHVLAVKGMMRRIARRAERGA